MLEAIRRSRLQGFATWMTPQDYRLHATHLFKSAIGNAYAVCVFNCALGVCRYARVNQLGKVAFVIEGGQPNVRWIKEVLEDMRAKPKYGIAYVVVANKHDFVQLYTADFLAHSCTSDQEWFGRLYSTGLVRKQRIDAARIRKMSIDLTQRHKVLKRDKRLSKARRGNY